MLLEEKFLEFHRYASSHNLPLEAISVGDENRYSVRCTTQQMHREIFIHIPRVLR